ncbi:hypothetical protein [Frigoriglobus tundricola]|uniref:Uncharacterized protein n=1 Tax=Frigoriglobus tundricola TaxID=2774151 RepID=A0A6M5Z430_9BACT|nr:hypothetical protein [Frigoriglobus tundricola]QJX00271.1 hypothetical protein FTUN_7896 [Frigoriglobus tundricola]
MLGRVGFVSLLLLLPLLAGGCFRGLAYPEFPACPGTTLPPTTDEVFAVRIDVTNERNGPTIQAATETERHTASRIDVTDGKVPEQRALTFSYWWVASTGDKPTTESRSHAVMVKLYRRGYRAIVLRPGDTAVASEWTPAPTPREQAIAIRDFAYAGRQPGVPPKPVPGQSVAAQQVAAQKTRVHLAPGSAGDHHKKVLVFMAAEFERVAGLYPPGSVEDVTLRKDADEVRQLAER